MPAYTSQGLTLHYRDQGMGPALVLIHGWGADSSEWEDAGWTRAFPGRRLLIPDVRGHGQSAKPTDVSAYAMERLAEDILALIRAVGVAEADVFGYSMGGAIALWTAIAAPVMVRCLIAGAMSGSDPDQAAAMGRQLLGGEPMTPRAQIYRDYALANGTTDLAPVAAALQAGLRCPSCVSLAVYGGEALVVAGDQDRRATFTQETADCLPGGRFVMLEGVDHMGTFGDPRFVAEAQAFLAEWSPL